MQLSRVFFIRVIQAAFSLAIIYILILQVDWHSVRNIIKSGLFYELWPGPIIFILSLLLAAERWRVVLGCFNLTLRRIEAFSMYLIGTFYSVLMPGVLGGDLIRVALCRAKTGGSTISVLTSVGIERGLGLWGVTLIGSVGAFAISSAMQKELGIFMLLTPLLLAIGIPLVLLTVWWLAAQVSRLKLSGQWLGGVIESAHGLIVQAKSVPPALALKTLLFSTAFQSSEIFIYYYFGFLLKIDVPFVFYLFVIPMVYLGTALPISLGGIGVREGILVWFLSLIGVSASDAVMLAFFVYLNRIVVAGIGGGVHFSMLLFKRD